MSTEGGVETVNARAGLSRVRSGVTGGASSVRAKLDVVSKGANLARRVADLEADMQEQRELSMRVAQLTDIVQELLIPVADRDEERLHQLLHEYAETL